MLVIKRPVMGIIVGALLASIWPVSILLTAPFFLLFIGLFKRDAFTWALSMTLGMAWVSGHWAVVEGAAVPETQGKTQKFEVGELRDVRLLPFKTEFDFYPEHSSFAYKVSCYRCPYDMSSGEQWALNLRIKPIHSFQNPGGFDYREWILAQGYVAQAYVDVKDKRNQRLNAATIWSGSSIGNALDRTKYPIMSALLLGDKTGLDAQQRRFVFSSGIGHLFVVSGLHVGIVASLVAVLFYWLQRPLLFLHWSYAKEVSILMGVLAAAFYGMVTGLQVPALRAVLMLMMAGALLLQSKNRLPIDYFLLALLFVLILKPLAFMDMGSWLSFAIVFGFVVGFSQGVRQSWLLGLFKAQWLAFCVGGAVLIGHGLPLVPFSMVLNFVLVPLFAVLVMPLAVMSVMWAVWVDMQMLQWLENALQWLLQILMHGSEVMTWALPVHDANRWLCLIGLLILVLPRALRLRVLGVSVILLGLLMPYPRPEKGGFELTVLDVGQGSAALIRTAEHAVLVDTGASFMSGMTLADYVVLPFMRRVGVHQIDLLHLTHDDNDHAGGLPIMLNQSQQVVNQAECDEYQWQWDDVRFERFQAPGFKTGNNGSCLLKVTSAAGLSVLFTGDIEKEAEAELVAHYKAKLPSHVLIAPHHGSRSSSSDAFLDAVNAQWVFISAGFLNHYGHPHGQILAKYAQRNMGIYTTGENGAIQVEFPPRQEALVVSTYRP